MTQTLWNFETGWDASAVSDGTAATIANLGAQQVTTTGSVVFRSAAAMSGNLGVRVSTAAGQFGVFRLQPGGGSGAATSNQMSWLFNFRVASLTAAMTDNISFGMPRHSGGPVLYMRWLPDDSCVITDSTYALVVTLLPVGSDRTVRRWYSMVLNNSTGVYSFRVLDSAGTIINEVNGTYSWPATAAMGPIQLGMLTAPTGFGVELDYDYVVIGLGESAHIALPSGNTAPTANAGPGQTVQSYTLVTLSGGGTDTDGTIVSGAWTQTGGTAVTLGGSGLTRSFTAAPSVDGETLTFSLVITDNDGNPSPADTMTVTILPHIEWLETASGLVPIRRSA